MIRSRLFLELLLPAAVVGLTVAAIAITGGSVVHRRTIVDGEILRLRTAADAVAVHHNWFQLPPSEWHDDFQRLAHVAGVRLTVTDGEGTALADSQFDAVRLKPFDDRPELRLARTQGRGYVEDDRGRLALAVAVRDTPDSRQAIGGTTGPLLGFVRAEIDLTTTANAVDRWRLWAVALAGFAALATLAGIAWTTFRLTDPIETFVRAASSVVGPDEPHSPEPGSRLFGFAPLSAWLDRLAIGLVERIDRLRRDNRSLEAGGERLSAVLTGMAEGVLAVDRQDRILLANPAAASLLDLPDAKLAGRPLWEAVRIPAIQETVRAARGRGERRPQEIELPRSQTILAIQATPLPGEPSPGVVLVMHDVTELRRLENLRRDFVGNVSHELKTPLASIKAYTETLLEGAIDDRENNVRFLNRIDEQAERLHNLILDLLRLARIEAGTDVFEITKLNIGKVVEPCIDTHLAIARTKGVQLVTLPPAGPVRVNADPDGLRTVLDNLVDNAIHYTPAGGRVSVRWDRLGDAALIEVADTGIGIPAEHLPRIFERFHRVDKARSREHGGTGLGLAIVKHLVQVFGGRVEVRSEVGRGSTFRIELPGA